MQVHFTIALQFYVYANVDFYIHLSLHSCLFQLWFLCGGKEKAKLKELSNNISDRSEAQGTGIMSDLPLVNGDVSEANEPDTSGKSALYYIIHKDG